MEEKQPVDPDSSSIHKEEKVKLQTAVLAGEELDLPSYSLWNNYSYWNSVWLCKVRRFSYLIMPSLSIWKASARANVLSV